MNAIMLLTGEGTMVILTSHASPTDPALIRKLAGKGIEKFIAQEVPVELARARYGDHFDTVAADLREADDLRVLDYSGNRAFRLFSFGELGPVVECEGGAIVRRQS